MTYMAQYSQSCRGRQSSLLENDRNRERRPPNASLPGSEGSYVLENRSQLPLSELLSRNEKQEVPFQAPIEPSTSRRPVSPTFYFAAGDSFRSSGPIWQGCQLAPSNHLSLLGSNVLLCPVSECTDVSEQPVYLTTEEAADILKVSTKTVIRWIHAGRLRACKPGRGWRILVDDLPLPGSDREAEVIYLDDNGSNPLDPIVREAVVEALSDPPANASSVHANGAAAQDRIDIARASLAELVDAAASEVVFTAGATEANNLILLGFPYRHRRTVVTSVTEHSSVINPLRSIAEDGQIEVRVVPVDRTGTIDLDVLASMLDNTVAIVSVTAANSETGVLNPLDQIAHLAHAVGATFHTDATQLVGRLPLSMRDVGVDALSLSGHKMCGPQGIGALVVGRRLRRQLSPIVLGGGHEDGLRSGSSNIAGIVGLGAAARIAADPGDAARMRQLRDQLTTNLIASGGIVNGALAERLPNTLNIRFPGVFGDVILARTRFVAASLGSACNAGAIEPSPTLLAMGLSRTAAQESIRFSITRFTTQADISAASDAIAATVAEVRQLTKEVA